MESEWNLSDKIMMDIIRDRQLKPIDLINPHLSVEDVREFIKRLKEICDEGFGKVSWWEIKELAGEKLV